MGSGAKGQVASDLQRQYLLDMISPQSVRSSAASASAASPAASPARAGPGAASQPLPLPLPLPKDLAGVLANKDALPADLQQQYLLDMLKPNLASLRAQHPP